MPAPSRLIRWLLSVSAVLVAALSLVRVATWRFFDHGNLGFGDYLPVAWLGLRFDVQVVACVFLVVLGVAAVPGLRPFSSGAGRRISLGLLVAAFAGLSVFYVTDFLHFRYLNQRLNASALALMEDATISGEMVWQTYPVVRILLGCGAVLALWWWLVVALYRRAAAVTEPVGRTGRWVWPTLIAALAIVGVYGRVSQYPLRWSDAFALRSDFGANLALNPVQSFLSSLSFRQTGYDLAKVRAAYPRLAAYLGVTTPDAKALSYVRTVPERPLVGARRPNVVLVICESFSGYKSSMWGNPLDTTPYFAQLCREGVFFDQCYTPHFGTARGVWATITGLPDVAPVKTASRNPAMVDQHTILNDFKGYRKLYFLGGSTSWANVRGLLSNNIEGLQLFEEGSFRSPRLDVWGISDKNLFLEANEELARQAEPFFAIIQTAGNHRPYTIDPLDEPAFQRRDVPLAELQRHGFESLEEFNAFRYTDFSFRTFIEAARQKPYFDNTIFVFVGDHGIGGNAGTMFPRAWTEQALTAYHVPLLFYAPTLLTPRRIGSVASMLDILPTAAGLVGIGYRNSALGRDLLQQESHDGGRGNVAFIIDHNNKTVGAVQGAHYALRQLDGGRETTVWSDFHSPEQPPTTFNADLQAQATAFYETARYLLLNNRKPRADSVSTSDQRSAGAR